jgi:archaeal flagellin FlaB
MKMRTSWKKDKRAEMGVGTMIIFIAMVLVAAVAASVLISTANKVREQAQNTGDQAINNVASGFVVQDVTGNVLPDRSGIKNISVQIRLQAGSPAVNMDKVTVQFISGSTNNMMQMNSTGAPTSTRYVANQTLAKTVGGNTWSTANYVVQQGDMITISICNSAGNLNLKFTQSCTVKIVPAYGSPTTINFATPSYYSTDYVNLK